VTRASSASFAWLAAIASAGLCLSHAAGAQTRETPPCPMPEGPAREECSSRLWETLTGEKAAAIRTTPAMTPATTLAPVNGGGWVVSETTSPVDYSPQVSAATISHAAVEDAPSSLAIRCRLQRIELSVITGGSWKASDNGEFRVAYRIGEQPAVEEQWIAAPDGRAASFKGDALQVLQSLPDSGTMSISVFDWQGPAHEAAFQLDGLAAVRQRILAACKTAPAAPAAQGSARRPRRR
jgi:hypothetical protein